MTLWDHVLHLHKDINHHWIFSKQLLQHKCAVAKQLQCGCESPPCTTDTVLPSVTNSSRWFCWFWRSLSDDALNFELLLDLQPSKDFLDGWEDIYKLQFGINDSIKVQLTYSVISGILASSEKYLCCLPLADVLPKDLFSFCWLEEELWVNTCMLAWACPIWAALGWGCSACSWTGAALASGPLCGSRWATQRCKLLPWTKKNL